MAKYALGEKGAVLTGRYRITEFYANGLSILSSAQRSATGPGQVAAVGRLANQRLFLAIMVQACLCNSIGVYGFQLKKNTLLRVIPTLQIQAGSTCIQFLTWQLVHNKLSHESDTHTHAHLIDSSTLCGKTRVSGYRQKCWVRNK